MSKLIDIAAFTNIEDTYILQSMLQSENIDFFLKNQYSSTVFAGYNLANVIYLQIMDKDIEKAIQIIKDAGCEKFLTMDY